ncbi:MAG: glutamyl-tRNA reductase [Deltaproteobacteria bacterium]|nr:glutamyl-tRNA reductase [Deltaproteobacteria bacterium]
MANPRPHLFVLGLNHRSAPVEVRERLAFNNGTLEPALRRLVDSEVVREGTIISTCNRVEIVTCTPDLAIANEQVRTFLANEQRIARPLFEDHLYSLVGKDAVRHLFRVAASLDSLVVGEPQILGQVKDAYTVASSLGTLGEVLHRFFHKTFAVAKRVRSETQIAARAVSVSSAAVELARRIFDRLGDKTAMVIGAGEMGELAVRHLQNHGIGNILVTNRTYSRAVELAREFNGTVVPFEQLHKQLRLTDIVIGSAGGNDYLLRPEAVEEALRERRRRPMFFIDLGVPRNFDPHLNDLDNVFLYDIDDLQQVIEENKDEREREAKKAEAIVAEEVETFWHWFSGLEVTPTIVALRERAETIRRRELAKTLASLKDLPPHAQKAMDTLSAAMMNKLLHPQIAYLKNVGRSNEAGGTVDLATLRRIFGLDEENDE